MSIPPLSIQVGQCYLTRLEAVGKRGRWGFSLTAAVIQAWDVDRAEPRPDGRDCQEDEALPV